MNCREFIEFLLDYFAGDLPCETLALFDEHLRECPDCVAYLHCYESAITLARCACHDSEVTILAEVPEDLIQAILASRCASASE